MLNYNYRPLYNGNISSMTSNIGVLNSHGGKAQFYNYRYDQLNRLVGMDAYTGLEEATNSWTSLTAGDAYRERVRYDGNGNILRYVRHDQYGQLMDSLLYHYYDQRNQLRQVEDPAGSQVALGDMGNQSATNNYVYDPVGNMTGDLSEQMDPAGGHGVSWNVYGKITRITRSAATALSQSSELQYGYDAAGNRIHKSVSRFNSTITDYSSYVRDAQGNILAIYTASGEGSDLSALDLKLSERELYGSSRLGSDVSELRVDSLDAATPRQGTLSYYRGLRRYELVNHLGNVLAVISDRKIALPLGGSSLIAHYEPDVLTATDYYPFGMRMPGRQYGNGPVFAGGDYDSTSLVNGYSLPADLQLSARPDRQPEEYVAAASIELLPGFSSSEGDSYQLYIADETYAGSGNQPPPGSADGKAGYRFGFNGKENDNEVKGEGNQQDYGMRIYDPRLGKFLSVDPLTREYPWNSTYAYAENSPILFKDLDGLERVNYLKTKENGKTVLKYSNTKDVYVWTWKPHMGGTKLGFTLWELIKNPDKKYVTYEPTEGTVEKFDKVQFVTYYQTISYDSYDDMVNDKNGSPGYEHAKFYLAKGVQNAREENMANGGAGMYVNLFRKEAKAVESLVEPLGVEEVAAQEGGQLLLQPGPANLTQERLEHIVERHWFTSDAKGAGKFAEGTTGAGLKRMIQTATTKGSFRANTLGRPGTIAEYNFGRSIGTSSSGAPASSLRVIIGSNGNVITAFPF